MATKLYDWPASPNGRKVRALAIELGIRDLAIVPLDLMKGEHQSPAHIARNPNGKIPVIEDDGFILWESAAILQYLADKTPGGEKFYPTDLRTRAEVNKWLFWDQAHFASESVFPLIREHFVKPNFMNQPPNKDFIAAAEENFRRFGAVLNGALEGRQYLVNDRFTIADLAVAGTLMWRNEGKVDLAPFRHIQAWLGRVESRESWKKTAPPQR